MTKNKRDIAHKDMVKDKGKQLWKQIVPYWLRIVVLMFSVFSIGMSIWCASQLYRLKHIKPIKPAIVQYGPDSNLSEYQLEQQMRQIVRDEYATYQGELQSILAIAGIVFTLFTIGFPIMNHVFLQREHVDKLVKTIDEAKEIKDSAALAQSSIADADKRLQAVSNQVEQQRSALEQIILTQKREFNQQLETVASQLRDAGKLQYHLYTTALFEDNQDKKLKLVAEAIKLSPDDVALLNAIGILLCQTDLYTNAVEVFNKAAKIAPKDTTMLWYRHLAYDKDECPEEALSDLQKYYDLTADPEAWRRIVDYLKGFGRFREAISYAEGFVKKYDDLAEEDRSKWSETDKEKVNFLKCWLRNLGASQED